MTDSVKELIERLGITSADINVPPEVASEIDEAAAALTRLSEANAILKNTIQDLTTYTPEMIKQELAAKDARIEELTAALKGCADNQKNCESVITYMRRKIPDLPSYKDNTKRTHQALSEGET